VTKVIADISMSLDGYVTGPDPDAEHGLGRGGEALHTWAMGSDDPVDVAVLQQATGASGAVIMGRRLFDIIDGPHGWNDEVGYGADLAADPPFFVVTHAAPGSIRLELDFTFVTEGLAAAIHQARGRAGDQAVVIMGGAEVIRDAIDAGLVDELHLHLAPVLLGGGTRLFLSMDHHQLVQRSVRVSATATHLVYELGS
jgi:dihydrofolate reductase